MAFICDIVFKNNQVTLKELSQFVKKQLRSFSLEMYWQQVELHFKEFSHEPLNRANAIEYYGETGIDTTIEEIAQLATRENIASILAKITVLAERQDAHVEDTM